MKVSIGNIYGELIVLQDVGFGIFSGKRRSQWLCKCSCGKELLVCGNKLQTGNTRSCGCLISKTMKKLKWHDLAGNKYGRLSVIKLASRVKRNIIWECKCDCGESCMVRGSNLLSGRSQSCGCLCLEKITKHGLSKNLKAYTAYLRSDPTRRLKHRVSCSIRKALKSSKNGSIWQFLPYTINDLKLHLESLWEPWMNWDNYGGKMNDKRQTWNIDHIMPQCNFGYKSMDEDSFRACWALSNLQPLEKNANRKKWIAIQ